jgi:hypothetical protein
MKSILFVISDGIGNQLESVPAFFLCKKRFSNYRVCIYNIVPTAIEATKVIFGKIADEIIFAGTGPINRNKYSGQILMYPMINRLHGIPVLNKYMVNVNKMNIPETECDLLAVYPHYDVSIFDECRSVFNSIPAKNNMPDIILHNGYSKISVKAREKWVVKSYPYYEELSCKLADMSISVGSIGSKEEYVKGTVDLTGLKLVDTISTIKGCKLVISNDTSSYHLSNLISVKNIAIFTCTDYGKNYSKNFHRFTTIIRREDLPCSPCQRKADCYWLKMKSQCHWKCREIDVDVIVKKAKELL